MTRILFAVLALLGVLAGVAWVERPGLPRPERGAGGPVVVGLVDTGVEMGHPGLRGVVVRQRGFPELGADGAEVDGHGTRMALLISAAAPAARLVSARVTGDTGDVDAAIRWVVDQGARVLNLSLGGLPPDRADALDGSLRYAREHDVVIVAAAGNTATDAGVTSPAGRPGVIAVSAVDETRAFARRISVSGPEVMLAAPGVDVLAGGERSSGTSEAAAQVSGAAALVRARFPGDDAGQTTDRLTRTARDAGPPGRDPEYGYGVVDPAAAVASPS